MVRAGLGIRMNAYRACPDFLRTDAGKIDGVLALHAWRLGVQLLLTMIDRHALSAHIKTVERSGMTSTREKFCTLNLGDAADHQATQLILFRNCLLTARRRGLVVTGLVRNS